MYNQKKISLVCLFTFFLVASPYSSAKSDSFIGVLIKPIINNQYLTNGLMQGYHDNEISSHQTRESCQSSLVEWSNKTNATYKNLGLPMRWNQEVDVDGQISVTLRQSNGNLNELKICIKVFN